LAGPVYGKGKATEIIKLVDDMERHSVEDLLEMLR
jgi:hypothetical protein